MSERSDILNRSALVHCNDKACCLTMAMQLTPKSVTQNCLRNFCATFRRS
jgi:hypothetical protein